MLARQIIESEIFNKPPMWLKIFLFLLIEASHEGRGNINRGQCFMTYKTIQLKCRVSKSVVDHGIHWMKSVGMLGTRRVIGGMVVTICNYCRYQSPSTYRGDGEGETKGTHSAKAGIQKGQHITRMEEKKKRALTGKEDAYAPGCWTNAERMEILRLRELLIQDGWRPGQNERTHSSTGG